MGLQQMGWGWGGGRAGKVWESAAKRVAKAGYKAGGTGKRGMQSDYRNEGKMVFQTHLARMRHKHHQLLSTCAEQVFEHRQSSTECSISQQTTHHDTVLQM